VHSNRSPNLDILETMAIPPFAGNPQAIFQ
jgi:hypothetical protein